MSGLRSPVIALVTNRRAYGDNDASATSRLIATVAAAAAAGVDVIQLREGDLDDRKLLTMGAEIVAAARHTAATIVVNRRLGLAIACCAHGVHLPATSPSAARIRNSAPDGFLIGRSVHSVPEAEMAEREGGCDYLIFGTVFSSEHKPAGHRTAGLEELRRACSAVALPVLAIGGITLDRVPEVVRAGAAGVAAIGLFAAFADLPAPLARSRLEDLVRRIHQAFDSPSQGCLQ